MRSDSIYGQFMLSSLISQYRVMATWLITGLALKQQSSNCAVIGKSQRPIIVSTLVPDSLLTRRSPSNCSVIGKSQRPIIGSALVSDSLLTRRARIRPQTVTYTVTVSVTTMGRITFIPKTIRDVVWSCDESNQPSNLESATWMSSRKDRPRGLVFRVSHMNVIKKG